MPQVEQNQPDIVENIRLWPVRGAPDAKHRHSRLQNVPQTQNAARASQARGLVPGLLAHDPAFPRATCPLRQHAQCLVLAADVEMCRVQGLAVNLARRLLVKVDDRMMSAQKLHGLHTHVLAAFGSHENVYRTSDAGRRMRYAMSSVPSSSVASGQILKPPP